MSGTSRQPLLMAAGTTASRATGLLRTSALAAVLGVGLLSDAYVAAAVVPTMVLVLVTGGTLSSALVPLLSRPTDEPGRRRAARSAVLAVGGLGLVGTALLALTAPLLARVLSAGALGSPGYDERVRLVTVLLVLMAPQVLALALTAVTTAVLTERGRLGVVGWAPVLTNLSLLGLLAAYAVTHPRGQDPGTDGLLLLGLGTSAATAVGCLLQGRAAWPHLAGDGRWTADRGVLRQLRRVGSWSLLYVAANQVGLLAVLAVAARRDGVGTAYSWSFAVMQLPWAVVGVTVLSATLPALSRAASDRTRFDALAQAATRALLVLMLPAAVGLVLFAPLAADLLLGYGATTGEDLRLLARGIAVQAVALVPFAVFQLLTRSCYALDRPSWPAWTNVAVNAVTVCGALAALRPDSAFGVLTVLGVAYAGSYTVGCVVLLLVLRRTAAHVRGLLRPLAGAALACAAATAAVLGLRAGLGTGGPAQAATVLAFGLVLGPVVLPELRRALRSPRRDSAAVPTC